MRIAQTLNNAKWMPLFLTLTIAFRLAGGEPTTSPGSGDGRIHVIPALSAFSVKNGQTLTISAVVQSAVCVKEVVAEIAGVDTLHLSPSKQKDAINSDGTLGLWSAEWHAHSLHDRIYAVAIHVTSQDGHEYTDRSLHFSDPAAGVSENGDTRYIFDGMRRVSETGLNQGENNLNCAVVDTAGGFAYFGTYTNPSMIVKVKISRDLPPQRTDVLVLDSDISGLLSAVIDPVHGYAYFGTVTMPAAVVKIALNGSGPPRCVGTLILNPGEGCLYSAVIDPAHGYAYFGTNTSPGTIVKIGLNGSGAPVRLGALTLNPGENGLFSAVIDPSGKHAYFGTNTRPGIVVKAALNPDRDSVPEHAGSLKLSPGEDELQSAVMDNAGHAYFGTNTTPGIVVKVALSANAAPTRIGAVKLEPGENSLQSAAADPGGKFACFGTFCKPGSVVKIMMAGDEAPVRTGAVKLDAAEGNLHSPLFLSPGELLYGSWLAPARIFKFSISESEIKRGDDLVLNAAEGPVTSAVIDTHAGFAWLGINSKPGLVVKVALNGAGKPARVKSLRLNPGEDNLSCAVIDPERGYAYFGTNTKPGIIIKVGLKGDDAPLRIGAVILNPGEDNLACAAIDTASDYACFGTLTIPGIVVKARLNGDGPPLRKGAVALSPGENFLQCAVLDPATGCACFGTGTSPGIIIKTNVKDFDSPIRVGAVVLRRGENNLHCAVLDESGNAWFGTNTHPSFAIKIAGGAGEPVRAGSMTMDASEDCLESTFFDPHLGQIYFTSFAGLEDEPPRLLRLGLKGGPLPSKLGSLPLERHDRTIRGCSLVDGANGFAYLMTASQPASVIKIALGLQFAIHGTRMQLPEDANVTDVRFFSHGGSGHVRLAIFDNSKPRKLLWESAGTPAPEANSLLTLPISSGQPGALALTSGTYWLAWQTESRDLRASCTPVSTQEGFYLPCPFGPFPATVAGDSPTFEKWTEFITYERK